MGSLNMVEYGTIMWDMARWVIQSLPTEPATMAAGWTITTRMMGRRVHKILQQQTATGPRMPGRATGSNIREATDLDRRMLQLGGGILAAVPGLLTVGGTLKRRQ